MQPSLGCRILTAFPGTRARQVNRTSASHSDNLHTTLTPKSILLLTPFHAIYNLCDVQSVFLKSEDKFLLNNISSTGFTKTSNRQICEKFIKEADKFWIKKGKKYMTNEEIVINLFILAVVKGGDTFRMRVKYQQIQTELQIFGTHNN